MAGRHEREILTDVDPLLLHVVRHGAHGLPPEEDMNLGRSDYAVLSSTIAALGVGQNREVSAVHQEVARRMQLPALSPWEKRGNGYAPNYSHTASPWAIARHVKYIGQTVTDLVASAQGLRPIRESSLAARDWMVGLRAVSPRRGHLALQKEAAKQIDPIHAAKPRELPLRLYGRAIVIARLMPRVEERDMLAVGLLGAYRQLWERTAQDVGSPRVVVAMDRARMDSANYVYDELLGEDTHSMELAKLHQWIGELSREALGVEMGAVLGRSLRPTTQRGSVAR